MEPGREDMARDYAVSLFIEPEPREKTAPIKRSGLDRQQDRSNCNTRDSLGLCGV